MSTFSIRFKELRLNHKLTQDDLAKKLKISKSSISMYENGNREPDFETLELIADYFNVDMNFLLGKSNNTTRILNKQQYDLLSMYDQLNDDGQSKVCEYTSDLVASGRYDLRAGDGSVYGQSEDETA